MFRGVFRHPLPDSGESGNSQEPGLAILGLQRYLHTTHIPQSDLNKTHMGVFKMLPGFYSSVAFAKQFCTARIDQGSGCIIEFPLTAVSKVCLGCLGLNFEEIVQQMVQQMQCTCKVQVGPPDSSRFLRIPPHSGLGTAS